MTPRRFIIRDSEDRARLFADLAGRNDVYTVEITDGEKKRRTLSQNALFHMWVGQIASATSDDAESVKADMHIQHGIDLLRSHDPEYSEFIKAALGGRSRGTVKSMVEKGYIPCTRIMSKEVLAQYNDWVWREYSPHVRLTDPQARKYEGEMA